MFPGSRNSADPCKTGLATNFSEELSAFLGFGSTLIFLLMGRTSMFES
jgi:hypothetical protein